METFKADVHVCVFDKEKRESLHELVAGLHLQEIIVFIVLYTKLSSGFFFMHLILDQIRPKV